MDYKELLLESFVTLALNKVRTGLAMLGVIIGIGSVIALISLGQASQRSVENQIKSLGSNLLTITPGAQRSGGIRGASGGITTLTYNDAKAIENSSEITTVKNVSAEYSGRTQAVAGRNNTNTQVSGVTPEYANIRNIILTAGFFISDSHLTGMSKVAVLGSQTASDLFGEGVSPVGKNIRINGISFNVVGLMESKGGSGAMNQDDRIFVPLTTAQKLLFGVNYVSSIYVEADNENVMSQARDEIGYFLLERHKIKDPTQADFSIMSQEDILGTVSQVTGTFTTLLSGIAAISLIVGGIGIMNIMLVTVTERTREIGLRKALGAKKKIITAQFLIEAIMITFIGGIIGVILGMGISSILSRSMSLPFVFSLPSVLLAFGVSATIGVLFGWYPAQKAANLQPIDALRYE
ncbi:multidrug ABC transporter substrate-binding protein [Candidatus Beckwithbacteria bacterium CG10_big_fil_rev_8_21_14_0_10_34_10]|uniref:Multidrug ABC transporter substrate-binding protein n=1 Tax=Candidatus Beckwithbacteria bacterium CG10_big_fil_rev_8_21_14_0_10_34_10 TaxID=1974495 RepID=A0A2H0WAQ5_9BACT|nr:MAG: multidrug ABC transporter substrate-binding protein [Candidatus Beckwithbacteria bacterium CG10_big_fil_rev_8_21_14_0_10_34_10]